MLRQKDTFESEMREAKSNVKSGITPHGALRIKHDRPVRGGRVVDHNILWREVTVHQNTSMRPQRLNDAVDWLLNFGESKSRSLKKGLDSKEPKKLVVGEPLSQLRRGATSGMDHPEERPNILRELSVNVSGKKVGFPIAMVRRWEIFQRYRVTLGIDSDN
jgi:hypothetical protein